MEDVENIRLLQMAKERSDDIAVSFEDLMKEDGLTMEEIKELAEHVDYDLAVALYKKYGSELFADAFEDFDTGK